ncbi:TolB family protein [Streptomyces sp. NPDC001020]
MLFRRAVLTIGIVVATGLPMAGTATAAPGPAAGQITATDYSAGLPAMVSLDPVSGNVTKTFAQNAEDGVFSAKRSAVAYIQRDETCIPQPEGCSYARNLVVANADGSGQHILVKGIPHEGSGLPDVSHPDWSPDGKRVVYDSPRGLEWINTDGTGQEVLTNGDSGAFSPDGKSIAFNKATMYEKADGVYEYGWDIWVMDTATRKMRQVSTVRDARSAPGWSPDGRRIVFSTTHGLSVVDVATGAVTELESAWPTSFSSTRRPFFSPDGARIVFEAADRDYTHGVYVVDADGKNVRVLTNQPVIPTGWLNR